MITFGGERVKILTWLYTLVPVTFLKPFSLSYKLQGVLCIFLGEGVLLGL